MELELFQKNKFSLIKKELIKNGYCIVRNVFNKKKCEKIIKDIEKLFSFKKNIDIDKASKFGQVILRDLVLRDPKNFLSLIDNKFIIKVLDAFFNEPYILDNIMASNSINVKKKYKRIPHINSHVAIKDINSTTDIVGMICLDDFKKSNGATKIWPKSHLTGIKIQKIKKKLKILKKTKQIYVEAPRGSIVFFLGQLWHQIGKNSDNERRWAILIHYKKWWIKPSTDFTKCGKKIFNLLSKKQLELFGFNSISPKFNFKNKIKNLKTLREIKNVSTNYESALKY